MHLIRLQDVNHDELGLSRAIIQVMQLLGLYHAELARILHLSCGDVAKLAAAKHQLHKNSVAWIEAEKLVQVFEALFALCDADEACMHNWLRRHNQQLDGTPLYEMVDHLQIDRVLGLLSDHR